jgi:hypothetical protein
MDSGTQKTLGVLHLKELNVTDDTIWMEIQRRTDDFVRPGTETQKNVTHMHRKPRGNTSEGIEMSPIY